MQFHLLKKTDILFVLQHSCNSQMAVAVTYPALWWFGWICFASVLFLPPFFFFPPSLQSWTGNFRLQLEVWVTQHRLSEKQQGRLLMPHSWNWIFFPPSKHVSYQLISTQEWGCSAFLSDCEEILPFRSLCNCSARSWCAGFIAKKNPTGFLLSHHSGSMHFKEARRYLRARAYFVLLGNFLKFQVVVSSAGNSAALFGCQPWAVDIQDEHFQWWCFLGIVITIA